jgi:hypothetical protein
VTIELGALFQFLGCVLGGLGAYVAVRSDLADLKARMVLVEKSADAAHGRVDQLLSSNSSK